MEDAREQLLEAWRTNNRINLFLIDRISEEGLRCTLSARGGRDVARQFAHLHDIRVHLLANRAPDLAEGLEKFASRGEPGKQALAAALSESGGRIETFLLESAGGTPGRRPHKKGVITTLGYLISHESHHRGSIMLTLKQCGQKLDKSASYGIWNWDRR